MDRAILSRVLVTDRLLHGGEPVFVDNVVTAARRHGATVIILREKELESGPLSRLASDLVQASPIPVILAHRSDLALAAGVAGVHLGWTSPSVAVARQQVGPDLLIGVSVHGVEEARTRCGDSPDYLIFGPVRATPSKVGLVEPQGMGSLAEAVACSDVPVVAIGGLTASDEAAVQAAGAAGWAAIRAFVEEEEQQQ